MALSRSFLKGMGLTDEQVSAIVEAHTDTVEGLKGQIAQYKGDAEKLATVSKELDDLKANNDSDQWKTKYEAEKEAFATYKTAQETEKAKNAKVTAYKKLLKDAGISEKRIDAVARVTDLSKIEMVDGNIKDADTLTESIKTDWADFIVSSETKGADTTNPPQGGANEPDIEKMSMAEYAEYRSKK